MGLGLDGCDRLGDLLRGGVTISIKRLFEYVKNAAKVAHGHVAVHPAVNRVCYPGLESHPQHEIADLLNISRSYVSRVEKHAIELLRDEIGCAL